jgi:chromosomal replication initiation ATPase DnaA
MKTKLFNTILDVVSNVTEVNQADILSMRKDEEILEARILFVWFCHFNGMHIPDIMRFLGRKSESSVTDKIHDYHSWAATSAMFRLYAKKIAAVLPSQIEQVAENDILTT